MRRLVHSLLWVLVFGLGPGAVAAQPAVLVWPHSPDARDDDARLEDARAVEAAKFRVVSFDVIGAVLARHEREASEGQRDILDQVQKALDSVEQAYLEQRFDDMLIALAPLQGDSLDVLARPEHRAVLWQVEFQLGLAYLARNREGDAELARERFIRALNIRPERRPDGEIYGPDVANAFVQARAARSKLVARPVSIEANPPDARIVIDGVPVVSTREPVSLLPGTHFVYAIAPGHVEDGLTVTIGPRGALKIPLRRIDRGGPADRIGPAWARGDMRPHTRSGQRAIRAVLAQVKADIAIVVDRGRGRGGATARVISARQASGAIKGSTPADALARALRRISSDGQLVAADAMAGNQGPSSGGEGKSIPVYKRWWFWLGLGVLLAGAGVAAREARRDAARLRVFVPESAGTATAAPIWHW